MRRPMFSAWMKFSLDAARLGYDAARLGYEVQTVMALRMMKLARGGLAAEAEIQRMMTEKGVTFAEAAATLAPPAARWTRSSAACARASTRTSAASRANALK